MSNKPTKAQVHVDSALTNLSVAYVQGDNGFVADKVFPIVPVEHASDVYYIFDMGDFQRDEAKERAPATESAGGDYGLTTDNYSCRVKAFHKDVPWQTRANADPGIDLDRSATDYVTQKMLIAKEKQFVSSFMATSLWGYQRIGAALSGINTATHAVFWNDYTNSDPILDVENAATAVQAKTGFRPNKLVLGRRVFNVLKNHPDFLDRVKGGATPKEMAMVARQSMAALFEVDEVLVMDAVENTAKEGQTKSTDFIGGKNALLVYAAPRPGIMTPSAGYTFSWTGYIGASAQGIAISKFEMKHLKADRVEGEIAYDQKLVAAELGAYFSAIVE